MELFAPWEERYADPEYISDTFVSARLLPPDSSVLDLGVGKGCHAVWLAEEGLRATALEPTRNGIEPIRRLAAAGGLSPRADAFGGKPDRPFDAVLIFLHSYRHPRPCRLWPGGSQASLRLQRLCNGTRGGPPDPERLPTVRELVSACPEEGLLRLHRAEGMLPEGWGYGGPAFLIELIWRHPDA
jgi:hypothetical protein|nr:MAG: SAM-dependent methyltransferase [Bacteroidota bacterium]